MPEQMNNCTTCRYGEMVKKDLIQCQALPTAARPRVFYVVSGEIKHVLAMSISHSPVEIRDCQIWRERE